MVRGRQTGVRSVRSLLLRSNILIIFIPSLILFAFLFYTLIGDMRHVIHEERLRSLDQYNTHLEKVHRDVLYISNHLSMNSTINAKEE